MESVTIIPVARNAKERFIVSYEGDVISAAYMAGVTVDQCRKWLTEEGVREKLRKRGVVDPRLYRDIATKEDLQRWWTQMVWNPRSDPRIALKASELQGRALGLFVERREVTGADGAPLQLESLNINAQMPSSELEERVKKLKQRKVAVRTAIEEEMLG